MKKIFIILSVIVLMSIGTYMCKAHNMLDADIKASDICIEEARTFIKKVEFKKAEQKLNDALKLNNNNAEAYYELGKIEARKNNNYKAVNYFTKAIQISPNEDDYYVQRGASELILLQFEAFIYDMNKAIKLNPKNTNAYIALAGIHDRFGYREKALEYYDNAIKYSEISLDSLYIYRAGLKVRLKNYDGAITDFNKAIEIIKQGTENDKSRKMEYLKQNINEIQQAKKIFK